MHHTAFKDIQELGRAISDGLESYCKFDFPVVVICENDIGKVLGNTLKIMLGSDRKIICIDNIFVKDGDFVDVKTVMKGKEEPTSRRGSRRRASSRSSTRRSRRFRRNWRPK